MPSTDIQLDEKIKVTVQEPKRWKVIFLNDDATPMDFVVVATCHSEFVGKIFM